MTAEAFSSLAVGTVLGLSAGFAPGPLLALVITQTLRHGATDMPIILGSLFVLSRLSAFDRLLGGISLLGGLYVLYLAYESFRTGPVTLEEVHDQPRSFRKGALINALNPHPYLFWATVGGPLVLKSGQQSLVAPLLFVTGFYVFLVGSKLFLAFLAGRSRAFLAKKAYLWTMRVLGCLLAAFAVFLLKDALTYLGIV